MKKQTTRKKANSNNNMAYEQYSNEELYVKYAETKNQDIRNELILRNQPLVTYILNKYYSSNGLNEETRKELVQEGYIGLYHAIEGYQPSLGFKFSTYSCWWIRQSINNYLININPIIKIPSHIKAAQNKLQKQLKIENKNFVSDLYSIDPKDYSMTKKMLKSIKSAVSSKQVTSLNKPLYIDDTGGPGAMTTLEDVLPDTNNENNNNQDFNLDQKTIVGVVKDALKNMPEKRRLILLLRYNIINESDVIKK